MFRAVVASLGLVAALSTFVRASSPLVAEAPVNSVAAATTVSISTSTWTLVPTSNTAGRFGVLVNNPSGNNARMVGVLSTNSSTPTEATTVRPLEFAPATDFTFLPVSDKIYVYLLSLHTSAESVHVQEVKQ